MIKHPIQLSFHDQREQHSIHLAAYVIDLCNYSCIYCYNRMPRTLNKLNLTKLLNFIKSLHAQTQREISIELIGGEPTLHPDLYQFCKDVSFLDYVNNILIFSNFSKDIDFYHSILSLSNKIMFDLSYHSLNNKINNAYLFKINQIANIDAFHGKFIASIMFEPENNFKYSKCAFDILPKDKIGYANLDFRLIKPYNLKFKYTPDQIKYFNSLVKKYRKCKQEFNIVFDDGTEEIGSSELLDFDKSFQFKHWICNAGIDTYYIHHDTCIYVCQSYYIEGKQPMATIDSFSLPSQPCICQCDNCGCNWGIFKKIC